MMAGDDRHSFTRRQLLLGAAGAALTASTAEAASRNELYELCRQEVALPGLDPAHDGLRVVQLSDLHVGAYTPDSRLIAAIGKARELSPDLLVLTGDYVTTRSDPLERLFELLGSFSVPTVAVLGNHEYRTDTGALVSGLEQAGAAVLRNQHTELFLRGRSFRVVGLDDGHTGRDDAQAAFKGVPEAGSRLVLAHAPSSALKLRFAKDLCLSGHTHGGQVSLPGLTPVALRAWGQPFVAGRYEVNGNVLYVNRGIGSGGSFLPRFRTLPELSEFTLRRPV